MLLTCAYYRNRFDGSVWVLRAQGNRVVDAIGPLPPHVVTERVPMEHKGPKVDDVSGWETTGFELIGSTWELRERRQHAPRRVEAAQNDRGFLTMVI